MTDREITSYFTDQGITGICTLTRIVYTCICIYTHSLERTFQNRVLACNRVYRITNSRRSKHLHFPITPTDVMQFNSPSPPRDSLI